jgi:hypothetical protein
MLIGDHSNANAAGNLQPILRRHAVYNECVFEWFKRKRTPPPPLLPPPPPHDDEVMGRLEWNAADDGWVATVQLAPHSFRILIGGDDRPDESLLAHARQIFAAPERFVRQVDDVLEKEAQDFPDWKDELLRLHIQDVSLLWADEPGDGTVYLDGPDTDGRQWQCDLKKWEPVQPLSYDD